MNRTSSVLSRLCILIGAACASCDSSLILVKGASLEPFFVVSVRLLPADDPGPGFAGSPDGTAVEVGPRTEVAVRFSSPVDPDRIDGAIIVLREGEVDPLPGSEHLLNAETVVFAPSVDLGEGSLLIDILPGLGPRPEDRGLVSDDLDTDAEAIGGLSVPLQIEIFRSAPSASSDLRQTFLSSDAVSLEWLAAEDNATPAAELAYEVFVVISGETHDPLRPDAVTAPGETSALVDGLSPDTAYDALVIALDSFGNASESSGPLGFRTEELNLDDTTAPAFAGVTDLGPPLAANSTSASELLVRWQAASDDSDTPDRIRYNVYASESSGSQNFTCGPGTICATSAPGSTEHLLRGLDPSTEYFVIVHALDSTGNEDENLAEVSARTRTSYLREVQTIFDVSCGCHAGPLPDGGLTLVSYRSLLEGGGSEGQPGVDPIVEPGNPDRSYILQRIDESLPNFVPPRMPLGPDPLPVDSQERLRRWIREGALDN